MYRYALGLGQATQQQQRPDVLAAQLKFAEENMQYKIGPVMQQLTVDMTEIAKDQAIGSTVLIQSLAAIPGVGTIVAGIAVVAQALAGDRYQRKTQEVLGSMERDIKFMQGEAQAKSSKAVTASIESVKGDAIKLAISGMPLPQSTIALDGFLDDMLKRMGAGFEKIGKMIGKPFVQAIKSIEKALDKVSGKYAYEKVAVAANKGKQIAKIEFDNATIEIQKMVNSVAYKDQMRISLANSLREDPVINQILSQQHALRSELSESIETAQRYARS